MIVPECAVPNCKRDALIMFNSKLICGECLHILHQKNQKDQWEELIHATNQNS